MKDVQATKEEVPADSGLPRQLLRSWIRNCELFEYFVVVDDDLVWFGIAATSLETSVIGAPFVARAGS